MNHIKHFTEYCNFCSKKGEPKRHGSHLKWTCACTNVWETEAWEQFDARKAKEFAAECEAFEQLRLRRNRRWFW